MVCEKRTDAVEILHRRYIKGDPEQEVLLQVERAYAEVAHLIYACRVVVGLSQTQLAKRVGTTQSVISRLEDADYAGCTVNTLSRLAGAMGCRLTIGFETD